MRAGSGRAKSDDLPVLIFPSLSALKMKSESAVSESAEGNNAILSFPFALRSPYLSLVHVLL